MPNIKELAINNNNNDLRLKSVCYPCYLVCEFWRTICHSLHPSVGVAKFFETPASVSGESKNNKKNVCLIDENTPSCCLTLK